MEVRSLSTLDLKTAVLDKSVDRQQKALRRLEELQLVTRIDNSGGDEVFLLNNPDFFTNGNGEVLFGGQLVKKNVRQVLESVASGTLKLEEVGKNNVKALVEIFKGKKFVLEGENLDKARDFIYMPDSIEDAFDLEEIQKKKDSFVFLHKDISKSYLTDHPISTDLEKIPTFQVDVAMMVYGLGDGRREEDGALTVLKDVRDATRGRQRISGKWFIDNFGFTNVGGKNWGNPKALIEKFGGRLSETGLLTVVDFDRGERQLKILNKGTFMWNGDMYLLGKEYAGMGIKRLGDKRFSIVDNEGNTLKIFKTGVKKGAEGSVRSIKLDGAGRSRRFITKSAIDFVDDDKAVVVKFNDQGREILNLDQKDVSVFKKLCFEIGVGDAALGYVSDQDLLIVSELVNSLDKSQQNIAWEFIKRYEEFGLKYLAESYYQDSFNYEVINGSLSNYEKIWPVFELYYNILSDVSKMKDLVVESAGVLSNRDSQQLKIFTGRIEEAMRIRSKEIFDSVLLDQTPEASTQLKLLSRAVYAIKEATQKGSDMYSESTKPSVFENKRATRIFHGLGIMEGTKLVVTVRPEKFADTGPKDVSEPRIQFRFVDVDGNEINLRVDLDNEGVSLDFGSHEGTLHKTLNQLGISHHTHFAFERQFSDLKTFARIAKSFASAFNMNIWK